MLPRISFPFIISCRIKTEKSVVGSEPIRICSLDSCWQIALCRGYTNLYPRQPYIREVFCSKPGITVLSNFEIVANLKGTVFHFFASLTCIFFLLWVSLITLHFLKGCAYTLFCELCLYSPIRKSKHWVCHLICKSHFLLLLFVFAYGDFFLLCWFFFFLFMQSV